MSWHKIQDIIQNIFHVRFLSETFVIFIHNFPFVSLAFSFSLFLYTALAFFHSSSFFRLIEHFDVLCFSVAG